MTPRRWSLLAAALLGLAAMLTPVLIHPGQAYNAPLFPLVRAAVERVSWSSAGLLLVAGLIVGCFGAGPPWQLGLATMALFPLSAIAEMFADGTSHNLWPLEFVMYGVLSVPAIVGACVGRAARGASKP